MLIVAHQVIVNCMRYLLERLDESQILDIDRAADVPNCGVTSYEFDPTAGRHGKLVRRLDELRRAAARSRRAGHGRAGRAGRRRSPDRMAGREQPIRVTDVLLRAWALPQPEAGDDKDERGRTLVIAGSREMPGAAVLAATAALRAGAGKLLVATGAAAAGAVALALPEARVVALPETPAGGLAPEGAASLADAVRRVDAVLVGPGLVDEEPTCRFVAALLLAVRRDSGRPRRAGDGRGGEPRALRPAGRC